MKLVMSTWSSDDFNGDCDFAIVDVTSELATKILRRMDIVRRLHLEDVSVRELVFWDCTPEFFATPDDEELVELLPEDGDSYKTLPADRKIPDECFQSTECECLVIDVCGEAVEAFWRASPKHVEVTITTTSLPRSFIEQIASGSSALAGGPPDGATRRREHEYFLDLDGLLFRRQRQALVRLRDGNQPSAEDQELIEGLINLTDAIADQAHDRHGVDCLLDRGG
jgi:hypothetical protein